MVRKSTNSFGSFVSHAETKELRQYQQLASKFPPLSHDEMCQLSLTFCEGRDAELLIEEEKILNKIFQDNWDDDNILEKKDTVLQALEQYYDNIKDDFYKPKDVIDQYKKDLADAKHNYFLFVKTRELNDKKRRLLSRKISKGDAALTKFCNHNLQLAMSRVGICMRKNINAQHIPIEELISAANLGLVMGARQFDAKSGNKFSTYAAFHIDGQIYALIDIEDGKCGIKTGTKHEIKQQQMIATVKKNFKNRYGRVATNTELQSLSGVSINIIEEREKMPQVKTQSINAPIKPSESSSNSGDRPTSLEDIIRDAEDVESVLKQRETNHIMESLQEALKDLPLDQQRIIILNMGMGENDEIRPLSPGKIAKRLEMNVREVNKKLDTAKRYLYERLSMDGINTKILRELNIAQ